MARVDAHEGEVTSLTLTTDNSRLISGGADSSLRVWEINTLKELHILKGHKDTVTGIAVSSDDLFIISSSLDKSIRIWDAHELI